MKTTIRLADDLHRLAKAEAALRGRNLADLVEDGLRLVLQTPAHPHGRPNETAPMHGAEAAAKAAVNCELADSPPPEHPSGFGPDAPTTAAMQALREELQRTAQEKKG